MPANSQQPTANSQQHILRLWNGVADGFCSVHDALLTAYFGSALAVLGPKEKISLQQHREFGPSNPKKKIFR